MCRDFFYFLDTLYLKRSINKKNSPMVNITIITLSVLIGVVIIYAIYRLFGHSRREMECGSHGGHGGHYSRHRENPYESGMVPDGSVVMAPGSGDSAGLLVSALPPPPVERGGMQTIPAKRTLLAADPRDYGVEDSAQQSGMNSGDGSGEAPRPARFINANQGQKKKTAIKTSMLGECSSCI
jgi:hypothetical protein